MERQNIKTHLNPTGAGLTGQSFIYITPFHDSVGKSLIRGPDGRRPKACVARGHVHHYITSHQEEIQDDATLYYIEKTPIPLWSLDDLLTYETSY